MRQVFLDTETTGLDVAAGDRIVEIGCVELVNRRLTGRSLHHYFNPGRPNHVDAVKVHGLSDEFLAGKPLFDHVVDELIDFVREAEVIIHNAVFDSSFLDAELRRIGREPIVRHVSRITCSLMMARTAYPGKANSLDALCRRFEVDNSAREKHGALLDAGLLAEVYLRMTRGQESLGIETAEEIAELAARIVDFSSLPLLVLEADEDEAIAHAAVLADIARANRGRVVWAVPA